MADKPADVDPADFDPDEARAEEWSKPDAATVADGVPVEIEGNTPRPEHTGNHRMEPEEFARVLDKADRDAYANGLAAGYARGLAEGRAEVRAADWEDGVDAYARGLKVFLVANKFAMDYAEAMAEAVRPFVKRGG